MPTNIFPFAGTSPGTAGPYSDKQFAAFVQGLWNNGGDPGDSGVVPYSNGGAAPTGLLLGFGLDVNAAAVPNMSVNVGPGTAVVNGRWVQQTALQNLAVTANSSGNTRIDTVVLHVDFTLQTVTLQINLGTPSGTPVPPGMVQSGLIWEIPIADITVANLAASITQANIQPRQVPADPSGAIYLPVLNNSGAVLQIGDVVVWDTSAQQAVKTSTTANDTTVAGVMAGRTAVGAIGVLLIKGIGWVNTNGAVTNGQALIQSTTAKQAAPVALSTSGGIFAYALSTTSGSGLMPAFVDSSIVPRANNYLARSTKKQTTTYNTTSTSLVDMDSTNLSITVTPQSTAVLVLIQLGVVSIASVNSTGLFDFTVDGSTFSGGSAQIVWPASSQLFKFPVTIAAVVTGLSANVAHTFRIQWASLGGAQLTVTTLEAFTVIPLPS